MAVSGLARSQAAAGLRTTVVVPLYRSVRRSEALLTRFGEPFQVRVGDALESARLWHAYQADGLRVVCIEHDGFFDRDGLYGQDGADYADNPRRFAFFALAALHALRRLARGPTVLHAHDWHTALGPVYMRTAFAAQPDFSAIPTVLSVHNAGFQGAFGDENWLQAGLTSADLVTTVSPTHAGELRTSLGGFGLHDTFHSLGDRLVGVLNGIEPEIWDPASDPYIASCYSASELSGKAQCKAVLQRAYGLAVHSDVPLVGMCARLVGQKGFDLILDGALRSFPEAQFIFVGEGESRYAQALTKLAGAAPDRIAVHVGFSDAREHRLLAGADLLLMPSLYEPCGLTQMRAQRYGAIPVARRVGGLADTIDDGNTGFLFEEFTPVALELALGRALGCYRVSTAWVGHVRAAMHRPFGWENSAAQYEKLYARALQLRRPMEIPPEVSDHRMTRRRAQRLAFSEP